MDMGDERQKSASGTELDITRLEESTRQREVDACSHNLAALEAILDSRSEHFSETKNERTILATIKRENPQVDSPERKKKKVKFCSLEYCSPGGGALEDPHLREGSPGESCPAQAPPAPQSLEHRSKGVVAGGICGGRREKTDEERRKISYIPRLGKLSRLCKASGEEKEKQEKEKNMSENIEEFFQNDAKLEDLDTEDQLSSASSSKRPRTLCVDETRPSKFVRGYTGTKHLLPCAAMDLKVCPQSQKGSGAESPFNTSGSAKIKTPTSEKIEYPGCEDILQPKLLYSLGKCKKAKYGQIKVDPYITEARAFLRKQNALRTQQKKVLSDYTSSLHGITKQMEILDPARILGYQSKIPQQTEAMLARPGRNLSPGKSLDRRDDAQRGGNELIARAATNTAEAKAEIRKLGLSEKEYTSFRPVAGELRGCGVHETSLEITGSARSTLISGDNVAGSVKTERSENCFTRACGGHRPEPPPCTPAQNGAAMREKKAEVRKPLNRSCSNPVPGGRKPQVQERLQAPAQTSDASDTGGGRSEVERLREEVHTHKRVIRQLSLRLPAESYKENQPLSLGHMPSTSVDNVWEGLLRPCRPRQEASEAELQELVKLRAENSNLRTELQETRDQADLLEFRVLELTEGSDRFSEAERATADRGCEDKTEGPLPLNFEDLSLPLSIDSGLDLTADGRRVRCGAAEPAAQHRAEDLPQAPPAAAVQAHEAPSAPPHTAPHVGTEQQPTDAAALDGGEEQAACPPAELPDVISNFQHYLHQPRLLHAALLAAAEKLRSLDASVSELEAKVSSVTHENHYLTETLSSLHEAQETRTEASGTESEIVSRKTPSLHSDLSDSDSDSAPPDAALAKKRFEALSSFQESGIFEGGSDVNHAASQTEEDGEAAARSQERERLELDNARLHQDMQQLRQNYDQLLQNRDKCPRCVQWAEVDRGESRALKEQLRVAQGARKALYEEKCELEEAENDARLMVQRLDSQLTAAREMELLLSASLSQEQEICRELHTKVKELQYLQAAERSYRQGLMEKENLDEGAVNLVLDKDAYASQLEFVKHSLILLQVFRHFHLLNTWMSGGGGGQAPTGGLETVDECVRGNKAMEVAGDDHFKQRRDHIDETLIKIPDDPITSPQPALPSPVHTELNFPPAFLSLDEMINDHPKFPEFLMPGCADVGVQTELHDVRAGATDAPGGVVPPAPGGLGAEPSAPAPPRKVEVQTKSTMTVEKDLLSLRESFYLEQIEALQEEKSVLRKEFGEQRSVSVEREELLQDTIQELQSQLLDCERAREALQCEMELQKDKEETLSKDFHKYMEQSRNDQARSSELHEMEKIALRRDFEARVTEVDADRRRLAERCDDLQRQLSALWRELEGADAAGYEGAPHSAASPSREADDATLPSLTDAGRPDCSDVLDAVRRILRSEGALRARVTELEKKESAYRETIQEADQIMLSHVTSYKQRIDELEAASEHSEARVRQLQGSEERLRSSLKSNARCDQDVRVAELLEQLLTIEKSELDLKHKLWSLEKTEKELKIKVIEGEKAQESLRAELRDQDDLVRKMHGLQSENCALTQQLQRAHESVRRAVDKQQTESLLKGRVEELEYSENALKTTLQQTYSAHGLKERRLNQQVTALEEEVASWKKRVEAAHAKEAQILESELSLKRHLEAVRAELQDAQTELKMFSADESSSRTEVSRLRSQLRQANGELTEAEGINCSLRERLAALEQLQETLEGALEQRKRRHESDLLQLNLQVSQREARLEETETQLCALTQLHAAQELDLLAASPLEPVMRAARRLTAKLSLCEACCRSQGAAIEDLTLQLDTLTDLLSGAQHQDDSDGEEYGDPTERSPAATARTGAGALTAASQARPDEGVRHSSCSEGYASNCTSDVSTPSDETKCERTEDSSRTASPAPVPAPRRKRKLKRDMASSLRSSLKLRKKGGSTILEELEEKVRELEESMNAKDEELKLADGEATDLSSKLATAQQIAVTKEAEAAATRQALAELQRQLASSLHEHQTTERSLQTRHKAAEETWKQQAADLVLQLDELRARGHVKESLITALVMHIRAFLKPCKIEAIIDYINGSWEQIQDVGQRAEEEGPQPASPSGALNRKSADHDVQTVCALLRLPHEVAARSLGARAAAVAVVPLTEDAAVQTEEVSSAPLMVHRQIQTTFEAPDPEPSPLLVNSCALTNKPVSLSNTEEYNIAHSSLSSNNGGEAVSVPSYAVSNSSPPLGSVVDKINPAENRVLSSVHQFTQTPPLYSSKIGPHQKSFIPKIVKPQNIQSNREVHRTISFNSKLSSLARQVGMAPSRGHVRTSPVNSPSSAFAGPKFNTNPTETGGGHRRVTGVSAVASAHVGDPTSNPTPALRGAARSSSQVEERDLNKQSSSSQSPNEVCQQTCKKLRVNLAPQERSKCSWQAVRRISRTVSTALGAGCETKSSCNIIPRPSDLKITRWVGKDGVVIAWELQNHDGVVGFQVIVAGKVVQSIRSSKRTKALITGVSTTSSVSIGLVSVGADGRCSKPAVVICDRSKTSLTMH